MNDASGPISRPEGAGSPGSSRREGEDHAVWRRPSARYATARAVTALLATPLPVAVATFLALRVSSWWWLLAVPFVLGLLWTLVLGRRYVAALGFREQEEELLVREGLVHRQVVLVPYGRLQQVTLQEGFVDARFGLAKVVVRTASGSDVTVPGLEVATARELRTRLAHRTRQRDDGL